MRAALQRAWLERGPLAWLLLPFSALFGLLAAVRRAAYASGLLRSARAWVPVVVVGNVVVGGAGKTPVVIALAEHLRSRGIKVGIVSRGHGRRSRGCLQVTADGDPGAFGDEPLLIARRTGLPVFVAEARFDAVRALLASDASVQLVIADDGLQHLALARDIEVVVFDDRGVGNGWLLPAGPLREPWPRRADFVLRTPATPGIAGDVIERRLAAHAVDASGRAVPLAQLASSGASDALAGIAQPQKFFTQLAAAGIQLRHTHALPDHFAFDVPGPWLPADGTPLLCTEKDAAKLWPLAPHALAVPLQVAIEPAFWARFDALVDAKLSSADGPQAA